MESILVTGGSGFIGTNFIKYVVQQYPNWHIFNLDALTYAGVASWYDFAVATQDEAIDTGILSKKNPIRPIPTEKYPTPAKKKIDVSIIIINYNTRELTKKCIESIYHHTQKQRFEIIVIDNASTDGSYEDLSALEFENYQYIFNEKNTGFSKANNTASLAARGNYLFFINSDMVFVNDVVSLLVETIKNNPTTGIAGPRFHNPDGSLQISCRNFPNILFGLSKFIPFFKFFFPRQVLAYYQNERDYSIEQTVDTVSAGALMISRQLFEDIGRFDEFSFMYAEDADICRQVRDLGLKIVYCPDAVLVHFGGQSSRLNSYKAIWSYYFAFYHLYKKYYFGRIAIFIKPVFFLRALIAVIGNYFKKDKRVTWNNK